MSSDHGNPQYPDPSSAQAREETRGDVRDEAQRSQPEFQWLPASRWARGLLGAVAIAFVALVFSAYLHPNMVFDLANMVFCG